MIKREEVYKIGIFNKPHGIHGELSFTFTDDIFDRVEAEYLICLLDGILVPFWANTNGILLIRSTPEFRPGGMKARGG